MLRTFFGSAPARALILAALVASASRPSSAQEPPSLDESRLADRIDDLLKAEMALWYPRAIVPGGGFHQSFARDWSPTPDSNRFLVYQARMAWTAAAMAEHDEGHRDAYLDHARHGIAYLDEVMRDDEHGGFHWILGPDGEVAPRLGDEKHAYATSFVIYAGAKVHEVSGDARALEVARDAFDWLDAHAHDDEHGGYHEATRRDGTPILDRDPEAPRPRQFNRMSQYYGTKSMNAHIHLLEAVAELARVDDRPIVRERLGELHRVVRDRIAVEPGALNLYFTRDWRPMPAHDSFGHDVETAYLLVEAAGVLGIPDDPETWRVARSLVDHALDFGWDAEHGGFFDKGDVFGPVLDPKKVWWTQAEGLNALMLMHRRFGDETGRYRDAFALQWRFIEDHLLDDEFGGWFSEAEADGGRVGDGQKASQWKANYHTARAMINVVRMLRDEGHP
ncbi:AGE family epimerase/isomerase [Tautonia plasticadhaerens]|uniref:Cellobiose 2-epimerase n=1 Tax=Tautonia plasticadhaerens TaxID=2527974 RepID=A0A518H6Y4_9BACT|nr:AGE family epimerase/isomerase [Tautonia plasticadhaerens]QDV36582.1 Cellobiose 2-epimerase [Tautonia plasticadhaerens]